MLEFTRSYACLSGRPGRAFRTAPSLLPAGRLLFLVTLFLLAAVRVAAETHSEYAVKASFVLNFTKLIEPKVPVQRWEVCIAGNSEVWENFTILTSQSAQSEVPIHLSRIAEAVPSTCNAIFISRSSPIAAPILLKSIESSGAISIVEEEIPHRFSPSVIRFFDLNNRVQFQIDLEAAKREGLTISSRLLRVARIIGEDRANEG